MIQTIVTHPLFTLLPKIHTASGGHSNAFFKSIYMVAGGKVATWPTLTIHLNISQIGPDNWETALFILQGRKIWAPHGGKVAMAYPDHPPKYQPNRPKNSWEKAPITL